MGIRLAEVDRPKNNYLELQNMGDHVAKMVHGALDAFARMDVDSAIKVSKRDDQVDQEYDGLMRQCLTHMMEDPRKITQMLDIMWAARAIERIGDHAKNICEYVIYLVKGKDVRHITIEQIEDELGK
jgi:phosphate transport system protein